MGDKISPDKKGESEAVYWCSLLSLPCNSFRNEQPPRKKNKKGVFISISCLFTCGSFPFRTRIAAGAIDGRNTEEQKPPGSFRVLLIIYVIALILFLAYSRSIIQQSNQAHEINDFLKWQLNNRTSKALKFLRCILPLALTKNGLVAVSNFCCQPISTSEYYLLMNRYPRKQNSA